MSISLNCKNCCGCGACESICPQKAITLVEDDESFLYPQINKDLCNDCNLCKKTCPRSFDSFTSDKDIEAFVGLYHSDDVLFHSSSGGAFTALYEIYIGLGYRVYGVAFDENNNAVHCGASTLKECEKFRKSKYIQSYYNNVYEDIIYDLKLGNKVLFSGTSCQCAALRLYLEARRMCLDNIVIINILCHGVPSQKMFNSYIKELENYKNARVDKYEFKNKQSQNGTVNTRTSLIHFDDGTKMIRDVNDDAYLRGYYTRLFYRPSCSVCQFARVERLSDYTILDAWNIETILPEYDPVSGVSLILLNTEKAKIVLDDLHTKMDLKKISTDWVLSSQKLFYEPTIIHRNRDYFFKLWPNLGFTKAVFKATRPSLKRKVIQLLPKNIKQKIIKTFNK